MTQRWYCIQIYPQFQRLAEYNLTRQGYTHHFGLRVTKQTSSPLFKGYGFVRLDLQRDQWSPINSTRGVIRLLPQHTRQPEPLPTGFVEQLIENDPIKDDDDLTTIFEEFFPGQLVKVTEGHLHGNTGRITKIRGKRLIELIFPRLDYSVIMDKNSLIRLDGTPDNSHC